MAYHTSGCPLILRYVSLDHVQAGTDVGHGATRSSAQEYCVWHQNVQTLLVSSTDVQRMLLPGEPPDPVVPRNQYCRRAPFLLVFQPPARAYPNSSARSAKVLCFNLSYGLEIAGLVRTRDHGDTGGADEANGVTRREYSLADLLTTLRRCPLLIQVSQLCRRYTPPMRICYSNIQHGIYYGPPVHWTAPLGKRLKPGSRGGTPPRANVSYFSSFFFFLLLLSLHLGNISSWDMLSQLLVEPVVL
eukprot:669017-Rhodomonas_salina.1